MRTKIYNGYIVDGTGKKGYLGELLIEDDKILEVGQQVQGNFDQSIDAEGKVIAPGFIDTHSHSDLELLKNPFVKPKIYQGITTEVLGQDGISMAPLPLAYIEDWKKNLAGLDGVAEEIDWTYETTEGYMKALEKRGMGVNAAYLVPHGNIRMEAMGLSSRKPTLEEMEKMKEILQRELDAGAVGLSTGLIYVPCAYADTEEVIELCKVVTENDGIFVVHQRSEANTILPSMEEIIEVGRCSGVKVHFSHFKVCGKKNWDKMEEVIRLLEEAQKEGIQISFDQYPYGAGSTMLGVILPPWAHDGGTQRLLERLKDPEMRKRIIEDILEEDCAWDNFVEFAGLEGIYITSVQTTENQEIIGKNLVELGKMKNKNPLEATLDLLLEEENAVGMIDYYGKEEHILRLIQRPEQNVCTDGLLGGKPHPRVYGSFPRILGRYVREQGVLSLEEAVYKMTNKPAKAFSIQDRGSLEKGKAADIVIFDADIIIDQGTYTEPEQYPLGIEMVMINGEVVMEKGKDQGKCAGRLLRKWAKDVR